jgi:hypothetical protein
MIPPGFWHRSLDHREAARSRLTRLAQVFEVRLRPLTDEQLDRRVGGERSIRQVALHLMESSYYANAVGNLH